MFGLGEAMLGFLRRQVGLRNDTNDPAGSLHAKIGNIQTYLDYGVLSRQAVASDALKFSSDDEVVTRETNYLKAKTILIMLSGIIRVSFDLQGGRFSGTNYTGYGLIHINGIPVGTERSVVGTASYPTFTEDIPCAAGDRIEIWTKSSSADGRVSVRNFRIYFDVVTTPVYGMVL